MREEWVDAVGSANSQVLEEAQGWIRTSISHRVKDPEDVDDLTQESLIAVYEKRGKLLDRPTGVAPEPWCRTFAINRTKEFQQSSARVTKREVSLDELGEEYCKNSSSRPLEDQVEHSLYLQALRQQVKRAGTPYQQRVWFLRIDGCDYSEIALELGRSEAAVRQAYSRIKRELEKLEGLDACG